MSSTNQAEFSARITNIGSSYKEIKPRDKLEVTMRTEIDYDSLTLQLTSPEANYSNMGAS